MNKVYNIIIFLITITGQIIPRDYAYTLENGNRQTGVFQPKIYGMKNNLELSTHPVLFFIIPNIRIKKYHGELKGFGLATRYSFDYPTSLLKLFQNEGKFGILSEDPEVGEVPHLFVFRGECLATKKISKYSLTGKLGISICPSCDLDSRHIIDYDLVYPRMALYHYGTGANMGLDLDYVHSEKNAIKLDLDILFIPEEPAFFEHKLLFHYHLSKKYTLSIGYKLSYGHYPFNKMGKYWWNMFPLLDLSWLWSK